MHAEPFESAELQAGVLFGHEAASLDEALARVRE